MPVLRLKEPFHQNANHSTLLALITSQTTVPLIRSNLQAASHAAFGLRHFDEIGTIDERKQHKGPLSLSCSMLRCSQLCKSFIYDIKDAITPVDESKEQQKHCAVVYM